MSKGFLKALGWALLVNTVGIIILRLGGVTNGWIAVWSIFVGLYYGARAQRADND